MRLRKLLDFLLCVFDEVRIWLICVSAFLIGPILAALLFRALFLVEGR